jgi:hypothetical protein
MRNSRGASSSKARPKVNLREAALWTAGLLVALAAFTMWAAREEKKASAKSHNWPEGAPLTLDPARLTLLLFVHPQCRGTEASLQTLARVMEHCAGHANVTIMLYEDPALLAHWKGSPIQSQAESIPGATVREDHLGEAASLFGVSTSGSALLFAPDGMLLYRGGITPGLGQAGDGEVLQTWLLEGRGVRREPVFGCSLQGISDHS